VAPIWGTRLGVVYPDFLSLTHTLSLSQVFHGTLKKLTHTKKTLTAGGKVESEQRSLTVDVKAGTLDGTQFVFDGEGHQAPGVQAGPVVFQLVTAPHAIFTRR
jgi:DnaJ-class molecular chaperone